jgi:hypothetical protein
VLLRLDPAQAVRDRGNCLLERRQCAGIPRHCWGRGPRLHGTSYPSHDERPWTLRGFYTPKFGHHLDTAGLSEPHI